MARDLFDPEHRAFADVVRTFVAKEIDDQYQDWERDGVTSREVWLAAGRQGLLGLDMPVRYGGGGQDDYRFQVILAEELARAGVYAPCIPLHNEVVGPYLRDLGTPQQHDRWLPGFCSGEKIGAIAITEPDAGSDLRGLRTRAVPGDDGSWVLNGQKTFISNGHLADLVIVVARTDGGSESRPRQPSATLFVVEAGMPGFHRGPKLDKLGMRALDSVELIFEDVRVPGENVLGRPGKALLYLMRNLRQERMWIAASALAAAEAVFAATLGYTRERKVFGRPVAHHQHNSFVLAELATALEVARAYTDRCIAEHGAGQLSTERAAMAKWWNTELCQRTVDRCLQMHGGYGFVRDYPVARAFADTRVQSIYGGSTEVMKEIIAQSLI